MFHRNSDQQWERYGREDPYFGVLSHEKFRGDPDAGARDEFFGSGAAQIDFVMSTARSHFGGDLRPAVAVDYGCGVGRCTLPLAQRCDHVYGVDVSPSMLAQARENGAARGVANVSFVRADDDLSQVPDGVDLVHCVLVFQHIRRRRGEQIFSRLVDKLAEGGVGAVQFVYHRDDPALVRLLGTLRRDLPLLHNLVNLAYGRPFSDPLMEKNVYDLNRLLAILEARDCGEVHTRFLGGGKLHSALLLFRKGGPPVPVEYYD